MPPGLSLVAAVSAKSDVGKGSEFFEMQNFEKLRSSEGKTDPTVFDVGKFESGLPVVFEVCRSLNGGDASSFADDLNELQCRVGNLSPKGGGEVH